MAGLKHHIPELVRLHHIQGGDKVMGKGGEGSIFPCSMIVQDMHTKVSTKMAHRQLLYDFILYAHI